MSEAVADDQLRAFFERWQRLEDEKSATSEGLKELFAEAKGEGFDTKVLRKVFRDKIADAADRAEFEAVYDMYWASLSGTRIANARDAREASDPILEPQEGKLGENPGTAGEPATEGMPSMVPSVVSLNRGPIRPYCLAIGTGVACAGQGRQHCYRCETAHRSQPVEIPHHGQVA